MFYDMHSIARVPKNFPSDIAIKNSTFIRFSSCGSAISNYDNDNASRDMVPTMNKDIDGAIYYNVIQMMEFSRKEYKKRFSPQTNLTGSNISITLINNSFEGFNSQLNPISDRIEVYGRAI